MNIDYLFPTPVLWHDVSDETAKRIESAFLSKEQYVHEAISNGSWGDNIDTSFDTEKNIAKTLGFSELIASVDNAAQQLLTAFNITKTLELKESWVNYQGKYQYQNVHEHSGFDISACYYLRATPNDGVFRVHPAVPGMSMWSFMNGDAAPSVVYKPRNGLILVFPSWMQHSVSQNLTDNTRISIAFNYKFKE